MTNFIYLFNLRRFFIYFYFPAGDEGRLYCRSSRGPFGAREENERQATLYPARRWLKEEVTLAHRRHIFCVTSTRGKICEPTVSDASSLKSNFITANKRSLT